MSSYEQKRASHKPTLESDSNSSGKMISTSDIPSRIKPQHTTVTGGGTFTSQKGVTTHVMDLRNKFGGDDIFQVHSHDGQTWHQVPRDKPRGGGDQVPLSPRSNQSMTDKFWK